MPFTLEEEQELNELAQWCHANPEAWFEETSDYSTGVGVHSELLAKLLDEYARLKVEVEALRVR